MMRITNILFDIKVRWAHIEYCIFGEVYLRPNDCNKLLTMYYKINLWNYHFNDNTICIIKIALHH